MTVRMVNIQRKPIVHREATAAGEIRLKPETIALIRGGRVEKGDPASIATIAGVQGAKLTPQLLPLCHPIGLENADIKVDVEDESISVTARVVASGKTGVEMEALTAVALALLNIWDVVKMYEKTKEGQYPTTRITNIRVVRKVKHEARR